MINDLFSALDQPRIGACGVSNRDRSLLPEIALGTVESCPKHRSFSIHAALKRVTLIRQAEVNCQTLQGHN